MLAREAEVGLNDVVGELGGAVYQRVAFPMSAARGESVLIEPRSAAAEDIRRLWRRVKGGVQ